jgi:hypothetical protein
MSYTRIIPRDLFNEGNLLKCLGQLYIKLETAGKHHAVFDEDSDDFAIEQDQNDGSISATGVTFSIRRCRMRLYRPLNARAPWPLWMALEDSDADPISVFNDDGNLSEDMRAAIK